MPLSKKEKIALLAKVSLFAELSPRTLGVIADKLTEIEIPAGRYVVRQGQIGTGCYVIVSGRVRVVRGNQVLGLLGSGEFFGELSLLDQMPRMAHVAATEPTLLLALASWDFNKLLARHPKVTLSILREVARRLRAVAEHPRH